MTHARKVWNWAQDSLDAILLATLVLPVFLLFPCRPAHAQAATNAHFVATSGHVLTADRFGVSGKFTVTIDN
jgi:hypothetical protein